MAAPKRKPKAKPAPEPELVINDIAQAPDPPVPALAKRKRVRKPKEPTPAELRKEKDRKQRELLWRLIIAKKKKLAALKFLAEYQKRNRLEYFNGPNALVNGKYLRANPKQQLILDAWNRPELKTFVYTGGNRCLLGSTVLYDPVSGDTERMDRLKYPGHVYAWDMTRGEMVVARRTPAFSKGRLAAVRVTYAPAGYYPDTTKNRRSPIGMAIIGAKDHRILTTGGWCGLGQLREDMQLVHPKTDMRVVSVEDYGVREMWDITVPGYGNYEANDSFHHNSGKTTLGVIISLSVMFGQWLWSKQEILFPHKEPRKVRVVSQDWEAGVMKVLIPELKKWWPEIRPHTARKNNVGAEAYWVDKTSGSTLEIMTGNQDPMLHEGGHHDLIWFDEPISRAHYIANARGLVDRQGRELFTMTLLEQPWIDREIVRKTLKDADGRDTGKPDPSVFVVETMTTDNVGYGLTQRGLDDFAAKLTDEELEVRIKGVPRYKKGLVYPMFNRQIHVRERFRVPLDWPVDIAIDTHPRKPHSVLFMATNPRGLKYAVAEIRMHGNGTQLADEIVRMVQWGVYRVNRVVIDPLSKGDDNDPTGSTYAKVRDVLGRYDMVLETASKNKDTGILMVKEHLMGPNQEPSLFFFDDLIYTIRELESLMWEKPVDEDREKAAKEGDDMCENLYRLILLETEYVPIEDGYEEEQPGVSSINEVTGY